MKLSGVDIKVWDGTLKQLQEIDVGSWFDPEFSVERVPTLAEVLEEVRGKSRLLIELKYYGYDQQLEQRIVDIVERAEMSSIKRLLIHTAVLVGRSVLQRTYRDESS